MTKAQREILADLITTTFLKVRRQTLAALDAAEAHCLQALRMQDQGTGTGTHESAQPCGCDPGAHYTCAAHRDSPTC